MTTMTTSLRGTPSLSGPGLTSWRSPIGVAASFNASLFRALGTLTSDEARYARTKGALRAGPVWAPQLREKNTAPVYNATFRSSRRATSGACVHQTTALTAQPGVSQVTARPTPENLTGNLAMG